MQALEDSICAVLLLCFVWHKALVSRELNATGKGSAIQSLFTGTIAKVASLVAIVIGGYAFAHGEPGAKKAARWCCRRNRNCRSRGECPELAQRCSRAAKITP
jgi:type IV secretory pathway VirB2 component (pilin)